VNGSTPTVASSNPRALPTLLMIGRATDAASSPPTPGSAANSPVIPGDSPTTRIRNTTASAAKATSAKFATPAKIVSARR
jgi:hypothetical protein